MSTTSKSPLAILRTAHEVARTAIPAYSHVNSPKKFTQHQLFACLVLKASMKLDYRGLQALLIDCADLRDAIGMKAVPHWTAFQKSAARFLNDEHLAALLDRTVAGGPASTPQGAVDSTGMLTHHASSYYTRRRRETGDEGARTQYHRYPKLGLLCDGSTHQVLACATGTGPSPDVTDFAGLLKDAVGRRNLKWITADAGYDSEPNHRLAREVLKIRTAIPPTRGRPTLDGKPPTGRYRRLMTQRFNKSRYGQRWQVETVMSMIKRRQGDSLWSRSEHGWSRDMRLMVITHNILIP
jgi:Transposase DDE domain